MCSVNFFFPFRVFRYVFVFLKPNMVNTKPAKTAAPNAASGATNLSSTVFLKFLPKTQITFLLKHHASSDTFWTIETHYSFTMFFSGALQKLFNNRWKHLKRPSFVKQFLFSKALRHFFVFELCFGRSVEVPFKCVSGNWDAQGVLKWVLRGDGLRAGSFK